ncbi:hypothetical protein P154DRAFT_151097 [Amniculicola lignicola CBS 123094]|uniref:Uncharacterized protein n=1 Tax=Amniculicola lignicola CBS 123094 TaxID=1392246 RepID=A0A6A5WK90_9PLEO|nr:hypothetical protein P154DRAFT_151097 [Amniculicola lignicola CBS 123094]
MNEPFHSLLSFSVSPLVGHIVVSAYRSSLETGSSQSPTPRHIPTIATLLVPGSERMTTGGGCGLPTKQSRRETDTGTQSIGLPNVVDLAYSRPKDQHLIPAVYVHPSPFGLQIVAVVLDPSLFEKRQLQTDIEPSREQAKQRLCRHAARRRSAHICISRIHYGNLSPRNFPYCTLCPHSAGPLRLLYQPQVQIVFMESWLSVDLDGGPFVPGESRQVHSFNLF